MYFRSSVAVRSDGVDAAHNPAVPLIDVGSPPPIASLGCGICCSTITVRSRTKKHPGFDQGTLGFFIFCCFFAVSSGFLRGSTARVPIWVYFFGNKRISFSTMLPCGRPRPWKIAIWGEINEFPFRLCCPAGGLDLGKSFFFWK